MDVRHAPFRDRASEEIASLRAGLAGSPPEVPPRYLYDNVGSELFEQITQLEVYYQTRTEIGILERHAREIIRATRPRHITELGSGAGRKIRLLLEAWREVGGGETCTMFDINERFLRQSLERLEGDHPELTFRGIVGDFVHDLSCLDTQPDQLVIFFAGTMGNLHPQQRRAFLQELAQGMDATDSFLVGVDLVKDPARLVAAYDDPQGVTAAFNLNTLSSLNRRLDADFDPSSFRHRALYDEQNAWIEMRLVATRPMTVNLRRLEMSLTFDKGDELRTEISCKFTRGSLEAAAAEADLSITGWYTDPEGLYALALLRRSTP